MRINWGSAISVIASLPFLIAAIVMWAKAFGQTDEKKLALGCYLFGASYILWFPIHLWFWQFALTDPAPVGAGYIGQAVFQIAVPVIALIWLCFRRFRPVLTAVILVCLFSLVLQLFSYIYWSYGTPRNFSISAGHLSHLDSFYFALGTLTTAGTGSISAISETVRGLQTLQMGLDLAIVGFTVVLVLARYSNLFPRARAGARQDHEETARPTPVRRPAVPGIRVSPPGMRLNRSPRTRAARKLPRNAGCR